MEHTSESHLQQAVELAQQAAAQMKKAAYLAEQAAQLWQKALALANQEQVSQSSVPVQMSVPVPKRKKQQHRKTETTKLLERSSLRQAEHLTTLPAMVEHPLSSQPDHVWEDGDNWWKPCQETSSSDA